MCEKCADLDEKIEHYRAIVSRITDKIAEDGIAELIADLQAKKAELHPRDERVRPLISISNI